MSAASTPSLRSTSTTSYSPARPAITCTTLGSFARAIFSTRSSSCTLAVASSEASGSLGRYSERPPCGCIWPAILTLPAPARAMVRVAAAASSKARSEMSSEYAKAVLSPDTARTPTPWSMEKLPVLTMPSSRLQPSLLVDWKYRSA